MGISVAHHEEQRYDDCTSCYQYGVNCKKFEDLKTEDEYKAAGIPINSGPDNSGDKYIGRRDGNKN